MTDEPHSDTFTVYAAADVRRLVVLLDSLPALIAYWDRDLHNVFANSTYLEYFGRTPEDVRGIHIRELLGEELYARNLPYISGALAGETQLFERTLTDAVGTTRHTQASYIPDTVDGEVIGIFVLVTDVTPRVEAQRALAEAQALGELGSWSTDQATGIVTYSDEMLHILGVDPATFPRTVPAYLEFVHEDDREPLLARLSAAVEARDGYQADYRLVRPDGEVRYVHSKGRVECRPDGTVARLIGTAHDVTAMTRAARQLAELNDRLDRANQIQSDMLAMLGHEARQPLTAIRGFLEELTLGWDELSDDMKLRFLARASNAARRMNDLLDDVLTLANLETGTIRCTPLPTSVAELIGQAVTGAADADSVISEIRGAPLALVDQWQVRQVVTNLVSNAVKYGAPPVHVHAETAGGCVVISVTDNGPGVPPEFEPHLFQRFARAENAMTAAKRGSGFGLYIVRRLVEVNGGEVSYRRSESGGSTFTVRLPAAPAPD